VSETAVHRSARARVAFVSIASALLAACSGGGGGEPAPPLTLESVDVGGAGALPEASPFLNSRLLFHFSEPPDPSTVSPQTIRLRRNSDPNTALPGTLIVQGSDVVLVPALPTLAGLGGGTFAPGAQYSLVVEAGASGVRSERRGRLTAGLDVAFTTRSSEPLFLESPPGPPRVIGVFIDLDGNGSFEADGLCGAAREPEQFLDVAAPEFSACGASGDVVDLSQIPIATNVRVGSIARPLSIGLLLSEPVRPDSVLAPGAFSVTEVGVPVDTDGDGVPDADRPVPFRVDLVEELRRDTSLLGRHLVHVNLTILVTASPHTRLAVGCAGGLRDFSNEASLPFSTAIETGSTPATRDEVVEGFDDVSRLDRSSTAPWDLGGSGRLESGTGIGGSGVDGAFPPPGAGSPIVLDTSANGGVFQFTSFAIPAGTVVRADGPSPLVIRSIADATIDGALIADGHDGQPGRGNDASASEGGAGGPGGFRGGRSVAPADPSRCNAATPCFGERGDGPGGGYGGHRSNNYMGNSGAGGGASHRTMGSSATGGGNVQGLPNGTAGPTYGTADVASLIGGSGGGGGGSKPPAGTSISTFDTTGGGGGGGGGAVLVECGGTLRVNGLVSANGGIGGTGFFQPDSAPPPSAGGGGGSGGAIKLRARQIAPVRGTLATEGGARGTASGNEGNGGTGGRGWIRLEDDDGLVTAQQPSIVFTTGTVSATRSFAQSKWIATNAANVTWEFDASDPSSGNAYLLANGNAPRSVTDVVYAAPVDPRITVRFLFAGAMPLASNPNEPDPATDTGFVADLAALAGRPFIRFRVEFDATTPLGGLPVVEIDRIRVRLRYPG
jgi:hypothetical protein